MRLSVVKCFPLGKREQGLLIDLFEHKTMKEFATMGSQSDYLSPNMSPTSPATIYSFRPHSNWTISRKQPTYQHNIIEFGRDACVSGTPRTAKPAELLWLATREESREPVTSPVAFIHRNRINILKLPAKQSVTDLQSFVKTSSNTNSPFGPLSPGQVFSPNEQAVTVESRSPMQSFTTDVHWTHEISHSQMTSPEKIFVLVDGIAGNDDTRSSSPSGSDHYIDEENLRYKTELCRSWDETNFCRYGAKCQFAHGKEEIRQIARHPKYKTEICRSFANDGTCPYGTRCRFIHRSSRVPIEGGSPGVGQRGTGVDLCLPIEEAKSRVKHSTGAYRRLPIFEVICPLDGFPEITTLRLKPSSNSLNCQKQ